jgi:hypothetical protein
MKGEVAGSSLIIVNVLVATLGAELQYGTGGNRVRGRKRE